MHVVLIAAWEIWKMRNQRIFDNENFSINSWFVNFKSQCLLCLFVSRKMLGLPYVFG
jgi:hypothetical protein